MFAATTSPITASDLVTAANLVSTAISLLAVALFCYIVFCICRLWVFTTQAPVNPIDPITQRNIECEWLYVEKERLRLEQWKFDLENRKQKREEIAHMLSVIRELNRIDKNEEVFAHYTNELTAEIQRWFRETAPNIRWQSMPLAVQPPAESLTAEQQHLKEAMGDS